MAVTKTAVAGTFESHGDDFVHYIDGSGKMLCNIDGDGNIHGQDFLTPDGISLHSLQQEIISGLPTDIDIGTF